MLALYHMFSVRRTGIAGIDNILKTAWRSAQSQPGRAGGQQDFPGNPVTKPDGTVVGRSGAS